MRFNMYYLYKLMSEILFFDQQFGVIVLFGQLLNNLNPDSLNILSTQIMFCSNQWFDPKEGGE